MKQALGQVQKSVESMGAVSTDRAEAMHNTLTDILHQQQREPASVTDEEAYTILGEVNEDGSLRKEQDAAISSDTLDVKIERGLLESVERLSSLIHEKERTFDTFDDEEDDNEMCDSIIEDLGNILNAAKQHAKAMAEGSQEFGTAARLLNRFSKTHASNSLRLNSEGMTQPCCPSRRLYEFSASPSPI